MTLKIGIVGARGLSTENMRTLPALKVAKKLNRAP